MILFVFFAVALAIALTAFEFAEEIVEFKSQAITSLRRLRDELAFKNASLERELNKMETDYNSVKKQLSDMQDKESEFITRIFEQRKEVDSKNEENKSLIDANQNLQDRLFELEKHGDIMRKQHDKAILEFKKIKEERNALEAELKGAAKRKKTAAVAA